MTEEKSSANQYTRFVDGIFKKCQKSKGAAAQLRRADNPATEYQSWEILAGFGVDLDKGYKRLPYALIAASIAKDKAKDNGTLTLGSAIAKSFDDGNKSDQANARLRRLLACQDVEEICRILRSLLMLIQNKSKQPLDYASLLKDLSGFHYDPQRVKARWAMQFYQSEEKQKDEA